MKRGQKGGQRRLETKAKRGLQTEERGLKRAVQKVKKRAKVDNKRGEEVAAIKRQIRLQTNKEARKRKILKHLPHLSSLSHHLLIQEEAEHNKSL